MDIESYDRERRRLERIRDKARKNECSVLKTPKPDMFLVYDRLDGTLFLATMEDAERYIASIT